MQSYIWVFGDIHGMNHPLRLLYKNINENFLIEKLIFLGDYIDRGNDSKGVLDFLMELKDKSIFLIGNHEQLLLDIIHHRTENKEVIKSFYKNGGRKTLESFECKNINKLTSKFESKYIDFFNDLKYSYVICDANIDFKDIIFIHGGFISKVSIQDQLSIKTNEDYHSFIKKNRLKYDETFLWVRKDFYLMDSKNWEDKLIIHGHTPVQYLKEWFNNPPHINFTPKKYFNSGYSKFTTFQDSIPFFRLKKIAQKSIVISVNIDTGCAIGKRLSAIGLDLKNAKDNKIPIIIKQVDLANNNIFEFNTYISF